MESASLGLRAADLDLEVDDSGYLYVLSCVFLSRNLSFSVSLFLWISIFEFEQPLLVFLGLTLPMHDALMCTQP